MTREDRTRLRSTGTIVGTVLVVVVELCLLTGVWHLGDRLNDQREAAAVLWGVAFGTDGIGGGGTQALDAGLARLRATGVETGPGTAGAVVVSAVEGVRDAPRDVTRRVALERALEGLQDELDRTSTVRAVQAFSIHVGLLVVASLGWFAWFRRLVDRHRGRERRLTAQRVDDLRERRLLSLVQHSTDLVVVVEADGTMSFVTPSAPVVVGRDGEDLVGRHVRHLVGPDSPLLALLAEGRAGDQSVCLEIPHDDGHAVVTEGTLNNLLDEPTVAAWVLTLRDMTERHALTHRAFHDSLTGLANRALFTDRLAHAMERRDGVLAVVFLDLDDFKAVNDTWGHAAGDRLLVVIAERLRSVLRSGDTAARFGGDEFAVLLEDSDEAAATDIGLRLVAALAEPVTIDGRPCAVGASVGIALAEPSATTAEDVLRAADDAMYRAKAEGKAAVRVVEVDASGARPVPVPASAGLVTSVAPLDGGVAAQSAEEELVG